MLSVITLFGSSSLLVHPTESGSTYPKENKAVDRMSGTTGQAFTKSVDTVAIWLKSGGLLLFCPSSCTKSEEEPRQVSFTREEQRGYSREVARRRPSPRAPARTRPVPERLPL